MSRYLSQAVFLIGFLGMVNSVEAQTLDVSSESLKDILQSKNTRIQSAKLEHSASQERSGYLVRSFMPSIDIYGGQESFKTGTRPQRNQPSYGGEVSVNLYNGGRDLAESQIRDLDIERKNFQVMRVSSEELEKVRSSYWQSLFLKERLRITQGALEMNQQNLATAAKRIKSGVATDSDRFEFEMKSVDLKRELAELEVQLQNQLRLLKVQLGVEEEVSLNLIESYQHDHDEINWSQMEERYQFLYKESEIQAQQYALASKQNHRSWQPSVDAFAAYNQFNRTVRAGEPDMTESERRETVVGLRASMSLSSGLEFRRQALASRQESLAARSLAEYQKRVVEADLKGDIATLKVLHDQVHEAEENIRRAEKYYRITKSEYMRGVKNSPDVLGAAEKLIGMQNKRIQIIKDYQVAKAFLISRMGL